MTKDFKKQPANSIGFSQYGTGWMLGGVAIGLLAGLALYNLSNNHHNRGEPVAQEITGTTPTTPQAAASTGSIMDAPATDHLTLQDTPAPEEQQGDPIFSYHAVLPQMEVALPIAVQEAAAKAEKEQKTAVKPETKTSTTKTETATAPPVKPAEISKTNGFQIGAYKSENQAANLRARLSSSGLNTRIERAEVNGQTVFRVRLGPATNQEMLNKWQQTLSGMGISPMAVRM